MGEMVVAIYTLYVVYKNVDSLNPIIAIGQYYYANKYRRLSYDPGLLSVFQYCPSIYYCVCNDYKLFMQTKKYDI